MTMTKEELRELFKEKIGEYLPEHIRENCTVECVDVMKNNDTVLKGLTFNRGNGVPSPTFYIEDAYDPYLDGVPPEALMMELAENLEQSWDVELPMDFANVKYEEVKDKLVYQLVDVEHNRERLKECVNEKIGAELAMIFYVVVTQETGYMRAPVTDAMLELLEVDAEQLIADAKANMEKQFPAVLNCPADMMMDIMQMGKPRNLLEDPDLKLDERMYALSNTACFLGASSIMYEGMQEKLGNMIQGNYYVIPSSTMEVMIVPVNGAPEPREILDVIRDANERFCEPNDFLSNKLFMYDRGEKMLAEVKTPNRGRNLEWER